MDYFLPFISLLAQLFHLGKLWFGGQVIIAREWVWSRGPARWFSHHGPASGHLSKSNYGFMIQNWLSERLTVN